ncbi:MAG: hypothetical protein Q7J54_05440, partial [Candidatus Woesearchaeota archaeon]|nr:hypothetical protein [Candidatus Woesearchaeota archaeon]
EFRSSVSAGGAGWKITATGNYLGHKLLFAPRSAGATWETEVLTLTQNGNVGIGLTDPGAVLEVSGGENKLSIIRMVQRSSGAAAYGLDVGLDPTTGDPVFSRIVNNVVTEVFRIQRSTGNVGIGTTSPTEKLQVAGNIKANQFITGDITFNKNDKPVWRMYEDEDGLYVESLTTGKNYRVVLEEIK